jgi:hypothetical protein
MTSWFKQINPTTYLSYVYQHVGLEFRWFCRKMDDDQTGEAYPVDVNGHLYYNITELLSIPDSKPDDVSGGCFGDGPGPKIFLDNKLFQIVY